MHNTLKPRVGIFAVLLLSGCASAPERKDQSSNEPSFEARVAKLKLGMTKQQVIAIMGDNYLPGVRTQSAQGTFEGMHYMPSFGSRYATALKREFSFGVAGRHDADGVMLQLKDGRLVNISQF